MLIGNTVKMAIELNIFNKPVNVAIDEHDEPYTGNDNKYLIDAPFHKFRGTDMAYRFATLDCVGNNRFALSGIIKHPLDGIGNAKEVRMLIGHALSPGIKINTVLMDRGYLDSNVMNTVNSMKLKYIIPTKDNNKVKKFKNMDLKYCKDIYGNEFLFTVIRDNIGSLNKTYSNFVHIIYYSDKKHDFSFYTNINVNENNVMELAELYRKRWGIENGYQSRKIDIREKTHSNRMVIRYCLYFFSILVYNLWILINLIRRICGLSHIILMDFLIAMGNRKWKRIMNNNG
ncbi:transposase [Ferroplasma acidiphilum]|uniref:transposase n=1 Tax=Ferroplasma acidiphilum TaxID=74969 RepID=UPI001EED07B3|nr:transposase [Ferroplasma acidiphilum]